MLIVVFDIDHCMSFVYQNDDMRADHPVTIVPTLQFLSEAPGVFVGGKDCSLIALQDEAAAPKLGSSVRTLLYSGEFDINCNTLGTLHTLEANKWLGRSVLLTPILLLQLYWRLCNHPIVYSYCIGRAWNEAARSLWVVDDDVAGEYFTMDGVFSFLIVRNSGHLLPMDLPHVALDMLQRFLNADTFADRVLMREVEYLQQLQQMQEDQNTRTAAEATPTALLNENGNATATIFIIALLFMVALSLYAMHKLRFERSL